MTTIYNGLEYTTKSINRNFRIKVNGMVDGKKINKLVGVQGLIELIGVEMANKMLRRAFNSKDDKTVCKLRRGIKISFYVKKSDRAGSRKQKIIKMEKWSVKVVYNPEQFKKMGFDGEIAKFMRENKNVAIVGDKLGVDRHVIQYRTVKDWMNYKNPYSE